MSTQSIDSNLITKVVEVRYYGRKFDTEDLLNPAARTLNSFINNTLSRLNQERRLDANASEFRIHVTEGDGVKIKFNLPLKEKIKNCQIKEQEITIDIDDEFKRAAEEAINKGIGEVPEPLPENTFAQKCVATAKKICNLPYQLLNNMINLNSQTLDFGSVARNTTRAISPACVAFPIMLVVGGWMCMFTGAWLTLVAICRTLESLVFWKDKEYFINQLGLIAANFGFLLMGISMAAGGDLIATIGGLGFYAIFTAMYIVNIVKDGAFRHNLNKKLKTGTKEDILETLEWLKAQAENKEEFIRRTNENLYRRVKQEIGPLTFRLEPLNGLDNAQALYLIEAVSKQIYKQLYVDVLSLLIGVFGLVACLPMLQEAVQLTAALFAVSAVIWLFWGDFQFPDNLKNRAVNWLWENHHKDFEEMLKALNKCNPPNSPSPTSSPTSVSNAISPGTQPLHMAMT